MSEDEINEKLLALKVNIDDDQANELVDILKRRFIVRTDTYWKQKDDASILEKGNHYKRIIGKRKKSIPLKDKHIIKHLKGKITIGTPVISEDNKVKYILYDIDSNPHWKKVYHKIRNYFLETYKIPPLLERSGSENGFHVVIFFKKPVKASTAKNFATSIARDIGIKDKVEIFPKQKKLTSTKKYGNIIKIPLGINRKALRRSRILDPVTYAPLKTKDVIPYLKNIKTLSLVVEDDEPEPSEDKTFNYYLRQQLHCVKVAFALGTNQKPSNAKFKWLVARNFILSGAGDIKVHRFFAVQPDYDKSKTKTNINRSRERVIDEIYKLKLENPKDDSINRKTCIRGQTILPTCSQSNCCDISG